MDYFKEAQELVNYSELSLTKIKKEYDNCLSEKELKSSLLIEIKNFMENLRSALDYTAHGLFDKYGNKSISNPKIYFPYAWDGLDLVGFRNKNIIEQKIPGLTSKRGDIAAKIETYQYFYSIENHWLPKFMELNNENKHQKLSPQTRNESKELEISSNGASMIIGNGASITIGNGASIQFGNTIIPGGQTFNADHPPVTFGTGKKTVITWVSFLFVSNNELVIPLLENSFVGISKIVKELSEM
jgi:hypothetical protein